MNTVLTVEAGKARSHQGWGWEEVTDAIIRSLNDRREYLVFLLWGNDAKKKISLIDIGRHTVLSTSHPSGYSARKGFLGCGHFSRVNKALVDCKETLDPTFSAYRWSAYPVEAGHHKYPMN